MANVLLNIEKGIEVGAEDALRFVTGAENLTAKAGPGAVAALGVVLGAVAKAVADGGAVAETPLNITLDVQAFKDVIAVWPAVVLFAKSLGISL